MLNDVSHRKAFVFQFGSVQYDLSARTHLMGVLNITPDSFSDGGKFFSTEKAIDHALAMVDDGADFIDVGGESTRPGSELMPLEEELRRVLPVIETLSGKISVPISIDSYKAKVADAALSAGATLVNDISGLTFDEAMAETVARHNASVVIMHIKGTPRTMQQNPQYENVVAEVASFLKTQAQKTQAAGIAQIIVDPGIGFGKTLEHNLQLMRNLHEIAKIGFPLMVGPSRKSFIGTILDLPASERLEGTAAAVTACILNGAHIVRVHDVKEMKRVAKVADALKS